MESILIALRAMFLRLFNHATTLTLFNYSSQACDYLSHYPLIDPHHMNAYFRAYLTSKSMHYKHLMHVSYI